jgi:hypothetical protein
MLKNNSQNVRTKKLALSKETLRQLREKELAAVRGGGDQNPAPSPTADCY